MTTPEKKDIEFGREYYIGRSKGWDWFGTPRWWEIFVIIDGLNGSGGYWLREIWRWNNSSENIREDIKTLSREKSKEIDNKIFDNINFCKEILWRKNA